MIGRVGWLTPGQPTLGEGNMAHNSKARFEGRMVEYPSEGEYIFADDLESARTEMVRRHGPEAVAGQIRWTLRPAPVLGQ